MATTYVTFLILFFKCKHCFWSTEWKNQREEQNVFAIFKMRTVFSFPCLNQQSQIISNQSTQSNPITSPQHRNNNLFKFQNNNLPHLNVSYQLEWTFNMTTTNHNSKILWTSPWVYIILLSFGLGCLDLHSTK